MQLMKGVLHLMKNSLYQTAFLNAPEFERIFPTIVGNFAVRNPYSIPQNPYTCSMVHLPLCSNLHPPTIHPNTFLYSLSHKQYTPEDNTANQWVWMCIFVGEYHR